MAQILGLPEKSQPRPFSPWRYLLPIEKKSLDVDYFNYIDVGDGTILVQDPADSPLDNKNDVFTLFPKLPMENQLKIMHFACPGPRLLKVQVLLKNPPFDYLQMYVPYELHFSHCISSPDNSEFSHLENEHGFNNDVFPRFKRLTNPAMLFVNRTFRAEMLKHYRKFEYLWSQADPSYKTRLGMTGRVGDIKKQNVVYFNFLHDNLVFTDLDVLAYFTSRGVTQPNEFERYVRHLTLCQPVGYCRMENLPAILSRFQALETITLAHDKCLIHEHPRLCPRGIFEFHKELGTRTLGGETRLRVSFESSGRKVPYMVDIFAWSQRRSFRRIMGKPHQANSGFWTS
jgi:hypothetical protein